MVPTTDHLIPFAEITPKEMVKKMCKYLDII